MSVFWRRFFARRLAHAIIIFLIAGGMLHAHAALAQPDDDASGGAARADANFLVMTGKVARPEVSNARDMWRSESPLEDQRGARFESFFVTKYLPRITQPLLRANLPNFREDLFKDFFGKKPGNAGHVETLNKIVADFMYGIARGGRLATLNDGKKVYVYWRGSNLYTLTHQDVTKSVKSLKRSKKNFHPAVRYNAMLILANLNSKRQKVLVRSGEPVISEPASPYTRTFTVMLDVAMGKPYAPTPERFAKIEAGPAPDAVRVAALLGLKRHVTAKQDWNDSEQNLIIDEMLSLAAEQPTGEVGDGAKWCRRLALEIVGELGFAGKSGHVVGGLDAIIANSQTPLSVRCAAADALGKLNLAEAPEKTDLMTVAGNLAGLARDVCSNTLAVAEVNNEEIAAAGLMASLECVLVGFRGPRAAPDEDETTRQGGGIVSLLSEGDQAELRDEAIRTIRVAQGRAYRATIAANAAEEQKQLKVSTQSLIRKFAKN